MEVGRIEPEQAKEMTDSGSALLVCAYPDENKCREHHLKGAIFLEELYNRLSTLDKSQQIIMYCN